MPEEKKKPKIVNTVTLLEIRVHKLDNDKERTEVICQEMMATEYKQYTISKLLEALSIINRAVKRESLVKPVSNALWNKLKKKTKGAFGHNRFN
jgi:phenylpyruvate tautomerase PptA (4-oxalocrotonate tautomerase family)